MGAAADTAPYSSVDIIILYSSIVIGTRALRLRVLALRRYTKLNSVCGSFTVFTLLSDTLLVSAPLSLLRSSSLRQWLRQCLAIERQSVLAESTQITSPHNSESSFDITYDTCLCATLPSAQCVRAENPYTRSLCFC